VRSVIEMRLAVRLYRARLQPLASTASLAKAVRPVGWRVFVPGLSHDQGAEVITSGRRYLMSRWTEGPDNRAFLEALETLENDPRCKSARYELRCVEVPGLHLVCAWAHRMRGDQFVVPISALPRAIPTGEILTVSEVRPLLRQLARSKLSTQDPDASAG
jgi:hypothetical protein